MATAIMTDDELAAALAEWAENRPIYIAYNLADHVAATHGAKAEPQPVPVSPLALWIADKSFALAIECLRMGKPLTADDMAKLVEQTVVASIAAAARIEGGADDQ